MMISGTSPRGGPSPWLQRLRQPAVPPAVPLQGWRDTAMGATVAGLGVVVPFSSAGVSVMLALLVVLALCSARPLWRTASWREPVAALGLVLFAYIALNTVVMGGWTGASGAVINKYHELLLFPLLLAAMVAISRPDIFLLGLAAGAAGYALAHWAAAFVPSLADTLAPKRISAGFCLAVAAFVLFHQGGRRAWLWRGIAGFLAATVLFRIDGRTGHVILLMLALMVIWRSRPGRWRPLVLIVAPLILVVLALASPSVQKRLHETWAGVTTQRLDAGTSTSIRLALLTNGWTVAATHQPFGVGFSRYAEVHEPVARKRMSREPGWNPEGAAWEVRANNPHNEYLMQLACGGIPALALFLAWLVAAGLRRDASGRAPPTLTGVVLAFAVACLLNSLLMDFVEGHFYMAVLAWLLARQRRAAAPSAAG